MSVNQSQMNLIHRSSAVRSATPGRGVKRHGATNVPISLPFDATPGHQLENR